MHFLISIGIILAIIGIVLTGILKWPLKTSDKLLIKEYRIRHVEAELKNKGNAERTIMDIAYMSGFNSKTGFNRAFKEVTGKTPTEYLER